MKGFFFLQRKKINPFFEARRCFNFHAANDNLGDTENAKDEKAENAEDEKAEKAKVIADNHYNAETLAKKIEKLNTIPHSDFLKNHGKQNGERLKFLTGKEDISTAVGSEHTFHFGQNNALWEKSTAGQSFPNTITEVSIPSGDTFNKAGKYIRQGEGEFFHESNQTLRLTIHTGTTVKIESVITEQEIQQRTEKKVNSFTAQEKEEYGISNISSPEEQGEANIYLEAIKRNIDPKFVQLLPEKNHENWEETLTQIQRIQGMYYKNEVFENGNSEKYSLHFAAFVLEDFAPGDWKEKLKKYSPEQLDEIEKMENSTTDFLESDAILSHTETRRNINSYIDEYSNTYNIPKEFIKTIITTESNWEQNAVSSAGAGGLMQLMPRTAKDMLPNGNRFDPKANIEMGVKYFNRLKYILKQKKLLTVENLMASYNAGPGNVLKYNGVPPFTETQEYVKKGINMLRTNTNFSKIENSLTS